MTKVIKVTGITLVLMGALLSLTAYVHYHVNVSPASHHSAQHATPPLATPQSGWLHQMMLGRGIAP